MDIQVVILAAGMGTRLGRSLPKPLTQLKDGRSIMAQQLDNVHETFGDNPQVMIVVGFKLEHIMEAAPWASFVYNEFYDRTNTSKSLLKALRATGDRGVLWMNGDVVFHPGVLTRVQPLIDQGDSFVCVNTAATAEEEVKYTVGDDGFVANLSKTTQEALGEAVGINYVAPSDKKVLIARLEEVDDQDYFERGLELAIIKDKVNLTPVDISDLFAVEVDFDEDLEAANRYV